MLNGARVTTMLPVSDLARARAFYSDKLGLEPAADNPGGLLYNTGAGSFLLYPSQFRANGEHTQAMFQIDDVEAEVGRMRGLGVVFEEYDMPGLKTENGVVRAGPHTNAWFKDSEGNLIGLQQNG